MTKFQWIWLDGSENFCFWSLSSPEGKQNWICVILSIGKAYFYEFFQLTISKPSIVYTTPLFLAKAPLKLVNCPSPLFLGNLPSILVFREPPPKSGILQWTLKILKFFSVNTILTKFLLKMSHFEFLVITEKYFCPHKKISEILLRISSQLVIIC